MPMPMGEGFNFDFSANIGLNYFRKQSISQKLGKIKTSNFNYFLTNQHKLKKSSVLTRFILRKVMKICVKKLVMRWLMV